MSIIELPITRPPERGCIDPEWATILLRRFFKLGDRLIDPFGYPPVAEEVGRQLGIEVVSTDIRTGIDARKLPFKNGEFDGAFAHPPYWDAIKYSEDPRDLSNAKTYGEYLKGMKEVLKELWRVVKRGGTLLLIVGDRRKRGRFYPIHADLIVASREIGWELRDILIIRSMMHAVGYNKPGSKPPFISHIYCLILQKKTHTSQAG